MDLKELVKNAGILGAGGAGFPTHVKISCQAETVLVNGAECEPLLRVDQQLMELYPREIVEGLRLVVEHTGAKEGVIALKAHYRGAVAALTEALEGRENLRLHLLDAYYPAGDEQQIVYEVTGKVVPTGGLPLDVGAVVCNAGTLLNVARAAEGKRVVEKYVTIGGAVRRPKTVKVPVGMSCRELLEAAGGVTEPTGGLLAIPGDHPYWRLREEKLNLQLIQAVCCQCSLCTQLCPRNALGLNVQPHKAMRTIAQGVDLLGDVNGIFSCCNCGLCTYYACNFGLHPSQVMQQLKGALMAKGVKPRKEVFTSVDRGLGNKKVPVKRLVGRLGLTNYDVPAPLEDKLLQTDRVRILLRMGVGAPSVPVVAVGDKVRKNALVADIAPDKLGVKMHASISGTVTAVTGEYIEIRKATV